MKRSRTRVIAVTVFGLASGLATLMLVVATGSYVYLRSPAGGRFIANQAQKILQKDFACSFRAQEAEFDLFSGWHFKNLYLSCDKPGLKITEFSAQTFDARYEFSILDRWLRITEFRLASPHLVAEIERQRRPQNEVQEKADDGLNQKIEKLREFIENPPLKLEVQNFAVERMTYQVDLLEGADRLSLQGHGNLDLDLKFLRRRSLARGDFQFDVSAKDVAYAFLFTAKSQFNAELKKADQDWIYTFEPTQFQFAVRDLQMETPLDDGGIKKLVLSSLDFASALHVHAKSKQLLVLSRDSFDLVEANSKLNIGPLKISSVKSGQSSVLKVASQHLELISGLKDQLTLDYSYEASGFGKSGAGDKPIGPLQLSARGEAKLSRSLKEVALELKSFVEGRSQPKTTAEVNMNLKGLNDLDGPLDYEIKLQIPKLIAGGSSSSVELTSTGRGSSRQNALQLEAKSRVALLNSKFGSWKLDSELAFKKNHFISTQGQLLIEQVAQPPGQHLPFQLEQKIRMDHKISLQGDSGRMDLDFDIPMVKIKDKARLGKTHVLFTASSASMKSAKDVDFSFQANGGKISQVSPGNVTENAGVEAIPISSLDVGVRGGLRGGTALVIRELKVALNKTLMQFNGVVAANLATRDVQAKADISVLVPGDFPEMKGQKIKGGIHVPLALTVRHGRDVNLNGTIGIEALSWTKPTATGELGFSGLSGKIPFVEKIVLGKSGPTFTELISQNPFERVNFERLRPFLQDTQQIAVEKINWDERTFGPLFGFVSIEQNMLLLHEFDLDLASGRVYGEMFFDLYPKNLQLGLLARLTNLDLTEILPKHFLQRVPGGDKKISGRSGFVLDLNKSTIDGRIDITEIGGAQLITMINVLDPSYQDEKMNRARSLLEVGYPTAVALAFQEGYLNMDIDLHALGISQRESLRSVPVSGLISSATHDFFTKMETAENGDGEDAPEGDGT